MICKHHHYFPNFFGHFRELLIQHQLPVPFSPLPLVASHLLSVSEFACKYFIKSGIISDLSSCVCLLSLNMMFSWFICVVRVSKFSFLYGWIIFHLINITYFVYSHLLLNTWICFCLSAAVINATISVNTVYKDLFESLFSVLLGIYLEVECESYGNFWCLFFKELPKLFHSGCTILHSHQHVLRVSVFPYSCPYYFILKWEISH